MFKRGSILSNTLYVLLARVSEGGFSIVVFALVARYLGVDTFGVYAVVIATMWILFPFLSLGLNQILARRLAVSPDDVSTTIGNGMLLTVIMLIPVVVCVFFVIKIFAFEKMVNIAFFIAIGISVVRAFTKNFFGAIIASERMAYLTFITLSVKVLEIVNILVVIYLNLGFIFIFIATFVAEFLGFIVCVFLFRTKGPCIDKKYLTPLLKECIPVVASLFLVQGFLYTNVFVLKFLSTSTDIGLFQGPHRILIRIQMLTMSFFVAFLPLLSRFASSEENISKFNKFFAKTFKLLLIVTLPISIAGIIFSQDIIILLFGEDFSPASNALKILMISFPFLSLNVLYRYILLALQKYRVRVTSDVVGFFSNIFFSILFIPPFGFVGASIGMTMAVVAQFVFNSFIFAPYLQVTCLRKTFVVLTVSGLVVFLMVFWLNDINRLVLLGLSVLIYAGLLFSSRSLSREDVLYLKTLVGSGRPL